MHFLRNNTVQKRVDEKAADMEDSLCSIIRNTEFSLQLDESTLPGNESLLPEYVRFVHDEVGNRFITGCRYPG